MVAGLLLSAGSGGAAADELPALRLCTDPDDLPFSSSNPATPGFYVELGNEIAGALGRSFQPVWVPTFYAKRQIRQKLLGGQCDGFTGVPDDSSFMGPRLIFSKPVIQLGYALVAPPVMAVNSPRDLHGRRVAVQFSTPPQSLLAGESDVQMVTVLSPEEAMQDLANGSADVAFVWGPSAGWLNSTLLHGTDRVVAFEGDHMQWSAAIAFPRDRTELRDQVDRALAGLSDRIAALAAKYAFPVPAPGSRPVNPEAGAPPETNPLGPALEAAGGDIAAGHRLFNQTCAHCHGPDAVQGEQRRNLRLLRQRYGDEMPQMFMTTVTHGRVNKGMPNWSGIISNEEFRKILGFLTSVQEPGT
jgi:polar amino acid transport system substrate-binding protein